MQACYCNSGQLYSNCCEAFILGTSIPANALALMRSRFVAFVLGDIEYLKKTMLYPFAESTLHPFHWVKLEIIGQADLFHVEFKAYYIYCDKLHVLHEQSEFSLIDSRWFYKSGKHIEIDGHARPLSLNAPCPCASGKKYKNCHR